LSLPEVSFRFRATPDDAFAPSLAVAKRSRAARWWTLFWLALIVVAGVVSSSRPRGDALGLWLMLGIVVAYVAVWVGSRVWLRRRVTRDPRNTQEYTYTFSAHGFTSHNDRGDTLSWDWSAIPEVSEVQTSYVIGHASGCRCLLPKRAIPGADTEQTFRHIVQEHAPDRGSHLARERSVPAS
jgi:hypothetical protein